MLPQEIIRRKRDGRRLPDGEIVSFVSGIAGETIGEGQMAAFAMAVLLNGMDEGEKTSLTLAMAQSGTVLNWSGNDLNGPVVDKHSTGGVGDKVSLILAPIVAACGAYVPMISGRGLGHTGGTLDKMAAIPGYAIQPDLDLFRAVVKSAGCAIIGATQDLAPADRRLYAVRDVTATVESIDLITASILSKKLAAGLDVLVMDVKFGSGAFMPNLNDAERLADSIVRTGCGCGLKTTALLTDMNAVLGQTAGNGLEVAECIDILKSGKGDKRLIAVTLALAAEMLHSSGLAVSAADGHAQARRALEDGRAAERFARMVAALGGPADLLETPDAYLEAAPFVMPVQAMEAGHIAAIDVRAVGNAIVRLGGGRTHTGQPVDHAVGLTNVAGLGEIAGPGERPLAIVHARTADAAEQAASEIQAAFTLSPQGTPAPNPVIGRIAI
jgi:thymidine phosphorylase